MTGSSKLEEATTEKPQESDVAVGAATLWEMFLKNYKGKLPLPDEPIDQAISAQGFRILPITPFHLEALRHFNVPHEDPFDRLLLATALAERYTLSDRDKSILDFALAFVERD